MATDYDFIMKVGATAPTLDATLAGGPLNTRDLAASTVTLRLRSPSGVLLAYTPVEIVSPSGMTVRYTWPAPQVLPPGVYEGEWLVEWADGVIAIFPDDGYFLIKVMAALA